MWHVVSLHFSPFSSHTVIFLPFGQPLFLNMLIFLLSPYSFFNLLAKIYRQCQNMSIPFYIHLQRSCRMYILIIMSIASELLKILNTNTKGSYRHIYSRLSENGTHPRFYKGIDLDEIKEQTLRTTLSRLKKQGLIKNENKIWEITKKGIDHLKKDAGFRKICRPQSSAHSLKNMIIIFDIPELHRKKRDWLRIELINLGFSMLQKSVWFGPSPLPKEFVKYVNEINVLPYMKFFKAQEKDLV